MQLSSVLHLTSGLASGAADAAVRQQRSHTGASRLPEIVTTVAEWAAAFIEVMGVIIIALLALYALLYAIYRLLRGGDGHSVFREMRVRLVGGVLIGLELLVAADIIHTVAVELTYSSVGVLAIIVLIRTFLSFTLELELTGRWPWQKSPSELTAP